MCSTLAPVDRMHMRDNILVKNIKHNQLRTSHRMIER